MANETTEHVFFDGLKTILPLSLMLFVVSLAAAGSVPEEKMARWDVPLLEKAPAIDGTIGDEEWKAATVVSGVANQANNVLVPRPTMFYMGWDAGHIYLACRTWVKPGHKPPVAGRTPRSASHLDAGLELVFTPRGKNVPPGRPDMAFKWNLNALGYVGQLTRIAVGQMLKNWMPNFKTATHLTEPDSAPLGGRWLEIEMSMTPSDFELAGENQAGDEWGMMLGFDRLGPTFQRVPANTGYFDPTKHTVGVLVEDKPVGRIFMDGFPGPSDGIGHVRFEVHNPTDADVTVDAVAEYAEHVQAKGKKELTEKPLLARSAQIQVPAGETRSVMIKEDFPRGLKGSLGSMFYRLSHGGRDLVRYFSYFREGYPEKLVKAVPDKRAFPLSSQFDPVRNELQVTSDAYYLADPTSVDHVRYAIRPKDNGGLVATGRMQDPVTFYYRDRVQLPGLKPGHYVLEAELVAEDGDRIGPETTSFKKLDESAAFSEWWDNDLGDTSQIIPPFTPVKRSDSTVSVWGRSYDLGTLGLPSRIRSQNGRVSSNGARIVVVVDGTEHVISAEGTPSFTDTTDWRVAFVGAADGAGLRFRSNGWVEQDGLCYVELRYGPEGKESLKVDELRIEYVLDGEQAEVLACVGPGSNFSARTTRVLDSGQQGRLWDTLDTGLGGAQMTVGSFYPCVWLGSERRGLLWWGDDDQGWFPDDDVAAHSVRRDGDAVILTNHIIGQPVTLDEERTVTFSYMATPFRPLPKGWRASIHSRDGTFDGPHKSRKDPETGKNIRAWWCLTPPSHDPEEWGELWAQYREEAKKKVRKRRPFDPNRARNGAYVHNSIPLIGYYQSLDQKVKRYFSEAWGEGRYSCFTDTHSDYLLWIIDRAFGEGGLKTIYWDLFFPTPVKAPHVGVGYELPDGRIQPGYFGFNLRRFMMRLYALNVRHGLAPGGNVAHATNAPFLVAAPWVDAILDGEAHLIREDSSFDYVDGWPVDRMRALSCSHNFGYHVTWMDKIVFRGPEAMALRRQQFDYIRMFDSWGTHNYEIITGRMLRWGINDPDVEYVPFWRNPHVESGDEDVLVSTWRLPDRVMLGVFNYDGEKAREVELEVDLEALDLIPEKPWQEFIRAYSLDRQADYSGAWGKDDTPEEEWMGEPKLDVHARTLNVGKIPPHRGRFLCIRRF